MAHLKQSNRRRSSSSLCHRHPSAKPSSGFCASCLRERLVTIEAESSSPAAVQPPDLRRIRSHSVRNASAASVSEQPRRRSCDARSSASSLQNLFVDDDDEEKRLDLSIRKPLVPDLKEEEEEDIKGFDEESGGEEKKTMKEFIDLDLGSQIKKSNDLASIWSRKMKRLSLSNHHKERREEDAGGRRSCDVDPRLSLDGGRISFERPRASWDGCLIEKSYSKVAPPLSTVTETFTEKKEEEEEEEEEKSPGGTVQTRNYYSDSRRRRSFDRSSSIKKVDELKAISNARVSPETVGLFHGAKVLVTEKELRDSNWYSVKNHKPESKELGKICVAAKQDSSVELKKPKKKWGKGWNLWGLIQRKNNKETKTEQSLRLEGNAIEGSLAESLLKLRRVSKGETNGGGGVSEKLLKSYSVSARKSCDGVFSGGANIVGGFEGGRSSCDGLFHGSVNSVEVGRSSCDGLAHLHQRKANDGTRDNIDNSLLRLYLTPVRSHNKASKSGKSRLMN
ncbi:DUF740 family protein [Hirschfeldia incana]|nr:DUF740 family protein [Hirschfeldia incana]